MALLFSQPQRKRAKKTKNQGSSEHCPDNTYRVSKFAAYATRTIRARASNGAVA